MYYDTSTKKCTAVDPNCKTYINETGVCLQCYEGYVVNNDVNNSLNGMKC